jgi:hypothetical protein
VDVTFSSLVKSIKKDKRFQVSGFGTFTVLALSPAKIEQLEYHPDPTPTTIDVIIHRSHGKTLIQHAGDESCDTARRSLRSIDTSRAAWAGGGCSCRFHVKSKSFALYSPSRQATTFLAAVPHPS